MIGGVVGVVLRVRVGVVVLGLLLLCCVVPCFALGVEPGPLRISDFSLEPVVATRVIGPRVLVEGGEGCRPCQVVNVPYEAPFTQAAGRPWALTSRLRFESEELDGQIVPTRDPKDIVAVLPAGLLGFPLATPRCPATQLLVFTAEPCPADTQVGYARIVFTGGKESIDPLINLVPEAGQSAEFGIEDSSKVNVEFTARLIRVGEKGVGEGERYAITFVSKGLPLVELVGVELTFWGVPSDPSHDEMRGLFCGSTKYREELDCHKGGGETSGAPRTPFLQMPADCAAGPEAVTVRADSWEDQRYPEPMAEATAELPGATGCEALSFKPSIGVHPDTLQADAPVGLGVDVNVPVAESAKAPGTPQVRDAVLTFPTGMSFNPSVVDGIQACEESGPRGINFSGPESEEIGISGEAQLAPGHCPDASIVGSAEAVTPLLPTPVKGHVYLAKPGCGGPSQAACTDQDALDGNLYRLYLELGGTGELGIAGVNIKLQGNVEANPATGQLTTTFRGNPQTPFSELKVELNGGPRAGLANPTACGEAVTMADFSPWSAPGITPQGITVAGVPDGTPSSFYDVTGCGAPGSFRPGFIAGTITPQAGQYSPFTVDLSRADGQQFVKGIQVRTPPGLLGVVSNVSLCGQADANAGTCSSASRIGTVRVASGAGSHPFEIGGDIYLTGPYCGGGLAPATGVVGGCAPFGLSIVTHVVAGPFNLGTVVVRARVDIDPETSELIVTTDETGPYAIPQILFGVPLRIKNIAVTIDRQGFMFNPTNCSREQIIANVSSSENTTVTLTSPFKVGGCKDLAFKPRFSASTSGKTSRPRGASLDVKLSYPKGAFGSAANIRRAKVALPRRLPSRLTTLQKACPAHTFAANPASCPPASIIGIAKASTPVLPVVLEGPVYFVSHGGEAFPSLVIVLQGDNVRVDLTGTTFISKKGVTSSTFKSLPDVPVHSFELYLPQGKYSALAANGDLCKLQGKLKMPTEFVAQNGAKIKQQTNITVEGCKKPGRPQHRRQK